MVLQHFIIALGSNLSSNAAGPRDILKLALKLLNDAQLYVSARSRWYRSPAFPPGSGPDFVNAVVRAEAETGPAEVLTILHEIETRLGRVRTGRWQARVADLDLIAAGRTVLPDAATVSDWIEMDPADQMSRTPRELLLPHPRLQDRAFVLIPMREVAPDWVHPLTGRSVTQMIDALPTGARASVVPIPPE